MKKNKLKIVLLGCDGYIGHPLTLRLLEKGHRIVGIDNFSRRFSVENEIKSISASKIDKEYDRHSIYHKIGNFVFFKMDIVLADKFN